MGIQAVQFDPLRSMNLSSRVRDPKIKGLNGAVVMFAHTNVPKLKFPGILSGLRIVYVPMWKSLLYTWLGEVGPKLMKPQSFGYVWQVQK